MLLAIVAPVGTLIADLDALPAADPGSRALAPDLLAAVALALLEDLGRATARVAVLPVDELCREYQWEMPTPPLVSAP